MEDKKINRSFWIVFAILLGFAFIATVGNLFEFDRMNKLNTTGIRVMGMVDSIAASGSRTEIFVTFRAGNKEYHLSKKVKSNIVRGDSVPVYYLQTDPTTNGIATE
jgi:hypothetical protein